MKNTIIYLIGHYAVGKLTVARAIVDATNARLFDNHLANNVIFSLIQVDGRTSLPERVWDMIGVIRDQALLAMEELAPSDASFVLTNCLLESDPGDRATYEKVEQLAIARRSVFVPVILTASDTAHSCRMASPDRAERFKMTDAVAAARKRQTTELLRVNHPHRLDIDTTDMPPVEAARKIISYAASLAAGLSRNS
ncbi:hypothetical protein [Brucella cytisi]|uniref:Shikimate kinase n=1 Tax=Brucella cytisi TaxID=407152 RepID=A0A1J6HRW3_9HYPH|nr:hypothetical protein [Brucella cytisi]OIS95115.1 hypothetical protein BLA27_03805 [Brucella cytisi]